MSPHWYARKCGKDARRDGRKRRRYSGSKRQQTKKQINTALTSTQPVSQTSSSSSSSSQAGGRRCARLSPAQTNTEKVRHLGGCLMSNGCVTVCHRKLQYFLTCDLHFQSDGTETTIHLLLNTTPEDLRRFLDLT